MTGKRDKAFDTFTIRKLIFICKLRELMRENLLSGGLRAIRLLHRLIIRHFYLIRNEPRFIQELYLQVVGRMDRNFEQTLTTRRPNDPYGDALVDHNADVILSFFSAGINWRAWKSFDNAVSVETDELEEIYGRNKKWEELLASLSELSKCLAGGQLSASIRKDIIGIQKRKAEILAGDFLRCISYNATDFFPKLFASTGYLIKKGRKFTVPGIFTDKFSDSWERIREFIRNPVHKKFSVRLWKRIPCDIFQGNFSECCISIGIKKVYPAVKLPGVPGRKYPAGILNYLTDLGVQVAEILDDSENKVIGQCWLFVAMDGQGLPMLVADSFDLHHDYKSSSVWKTAIRDCMFDFLRKYAAAAGINKVILGHFGPRLKNGKIHRIHNDIRVDDLRQIRLRKPIQKLGGYFQDYPYFLESCGGEKAFLIHEDKTPQNSSLVELKEKLTPIGVKLK